MKTHKGKYTPENPGKYKGDPSKIVYRSSWERACFIWCDRNPNVEWWASEETVVPYRCATDGAMHRYFIDLTLKFKSGKKFLIEVKPSQQTERPKPQKRKSKRYLKECMTWAKNKSKWQAAERYAQKNGFVFTIWTEHSLKRLGMRIL